MADSVLARIEFRYWPEALACGIRPPEPIRRHQHEDARDDHLDRGALGVEPHLAVAAEGERADVAGAQPITADQLLRRLADLVQRVIERQVVEVRGLLQALEVVAVAEDRRYLGLGVVAADALEDPGAVVKPVREHVDVGVVPGHELAVFPDQLDLLHG